MQTRVGGFTALLHVCMCVKCLKSFCSFLIRGLREGVLGRAEGALKGWRATQRLWTGLQNRLWLWDRGQGLLPERAPMESWNFVHNQIKKWQFQKTLRLYRELSMCKGENNYLRTSVAQCLGLHALTALGLELGLWLGIRSTSQMWAALDLSFCPPAPPTAPPWELAPWLWPSMTCSTCASALSTPWLSRWTMAGHPWLSPPSQEDIP